MTFNVSNVQNLIGYTFKNQELLRQCFTHKSFSDEAKGELNNERLEFLGDSILGFVVADYLYKSGKCNEGEMTEVRKLYVSKEPLEQATKILGIDKYLIRGGGLELKGKTLANLFEAIIAGIYLDGGLKEAEEFIYNKLLKVINVEQSLNITQNNNYKGELNDYVLKKKLGTITYKLLSKSGEDHTPQFEIVVLVDGVSLATAVGKSKKEAEQLCAKTALEILKNK